MVGRLKESFRARMARAGLAKALELLAFCRSRKVFEWCPKFMGWLLDASYVLYLGLSIVNRPLVLVRLPSKSLA